MQRIQLKPRSPTKAEFDVILSALEGQYVEFKEKMSGLDREMVAFANSTGGRIYLGVDDDRSVKGINVTNKALSDIQSIARNCDPSIRINIIPFRYDQTSIIMIDVPEGKEKPYKCSEGYYLRTGPNSQKMRRDELIAIVISAETTAIEKLDCNDFVYPRAFDSKEFMAFLRMAEILTPRLPREDLLVNLGIARKDKSHLIFNTAGVLLFAKEPWRFLPQSRVTCVLFQDTSRLHILDRKDLNGPLLQNLEQAEVFLLKHLRVRYEIKGFDRIEHMELPLEAFREGLVNAFMHRDYSVQGGNIFVEIYPDRVSIVNPGGLAPGLAPEDFGVKSVHRNPTIADILFRAHKVERVGTGVRRIQEVIKKQGASPPEFRFSKESKFFELVLLRPLSFADTPKTADQASGEGGGKSGVSAGYVSLGFHGREILGLCLAPHSLTEIMAKVGIGKKDNMAPHMKRLIREGYLSFTIPDKPKSRYQKYQTTPKGEAQLKNIVGHFLDTSI
ncbi:MAG: putative DNA binding domain-containing protein [Elusimicrobia bacterium]|nr:putative DNA binding domain-containing protein [Candidatus Obscuribacterium magneticum]